MQQMPLSSSRLPLTVYLLSLCNALMYIGGSLLITVSALIGYELAPDKNLATLPMALQFLAVMTMSVPASFTMGRYGRKAGFLIAGLVGLGGAVLALWSIYNDLFWGFCAATLCFGTFTAFGNYYRFTASEVVDADHRSRAISMVMAGGVIAAFIGPNLASLSGDLIPGHAFAGPFAVLIGVYALSMLTIAAASLPPAPVRQHSRTGRGLADIIRQPTFIVAVICQMFGYGTMNLVMSSTPLAMRVHDYSLGSTALVIQWHVFAMFAPSFVTGHLIRRIGIAPVLTAGALLGFACVAINLHGQTLAHFVGALIVLGISWNFLFVGGTTLLGDAHTADEKTRAQAANDLIVFTTVTLTALSAGALHHLFGWRVVNLVSLPMYATALLATVWLVLHRRLPRSALQS